MLCGEGDTLLAIQSLIGAAGMVAFTYVLPFLFYAALAREPLTRRWKAWAATNVAIGVAVALLGCWSALQGIFGECTQWFAGECELRYTYAPDVPGDPCNESGLPSWAA